MGKTSKAVFLNRNHRKFQLRKSDWKHDVVYLYQFPRSKTIPNMSPFCLKVETFLKVNKIPYEVCPLLMGRSRYGLLPFVELNGEHIADSQIIISRLTKHFNIKRGISTMKKWLILLKVDCTLFGQLATVLYVPTNSYAKELLRDHYPTLVEYCGRIRDTVFGDEFASH
ncbi:unnamed protein product [Angiostrongylus costaricensis]|uniref:GST N-terminal domain-containing protein n=1 Tax=Angiostrongylus costaricensis TaxID=334426 RepID=A0A158PE12_ANGCS|nr:unnamed protein product [Angiostrongylus costaricensis]